MQTQPKKGRSPIVTIFAAIGAITMLCLCGIIANAIISTSSSGRTQAAQDTTRSSSAANVGSSQQNEAAQPPPPTQAQEAAEVPGSSRTNPAPVGQGIQVGEYALRVTQVVRPADNVVEAGNPFNSKPEAGQEYVQVVIDVACTAPANEKCMISPLNFKAVGSKGILRDAEIMVAGVDGQLETTQFYGGATLENKSIFFKVDKGETNIAMVFKTNLFIGSETFFTIPDAAQ